MQKEQVDLVRKVIEDKNISPQIRDEAHLQYLSIIDAMGKELQIEGILKAKGLIVWYFGRNSGTVVVKLSHLDKNTVAQIGDTVRHIARISLENITVIPAHK